MAAEGEKPLLLLDDVASEFDETFLSGIIFAGSELGLQTWITSVSARPFLQQKPGHLLRFHVKHGSLERIS